jgi:hypothetical protein
MGIICEWCNTEYNEDNPDHRACLNAAIRENEQLKAEVEELRRSVSIGGLG